MRILRIKAVVERTGLSRPTIWRKERAGLFPQRRKLSGSAVGWLEHEIEEWIESLPSPDRASNTREE